MQTIRSLFKNQIPSAVEAAEKRVAVPLNLGDALVQPGRGAQKPEVPMPAVVSAPAVVAPAPPIIEQAAPTPVPYCIHCGQALPPQVVVGQTGAQPVAIPAQILVDPDAERTDLPPRSSGEIARLIPFENEETRLKRILNDKMRYAHQQGR